jgi:hypothetical protein
LGVAGVKYTVGGVSNKVCNGQKGTTGAPGPEGSPWTAGGVLPSGKTETGAWLYGPGQAGLNRTSISFTIPLASPLDGSHVHYINSAGEEVSEGGAKKEPSTVCHGTAAAPSADAGHLCVYTFLEFETLAWNEFITDVAESPGTSTAGAILLTAAESASGNAQGAWAVTAP